MPTPDFSKIWASSSPLPAYTFTDAEYVTGWDFVGSAPPTKNEFDAWFRATDEKLNYLFSQLQDTASKLYPVGSVYISFNSANPSTLFGGTWARLKDTFLLANGDTYGANTTGGSATKTIAVTNLPAHNHSISSAGSHTHTATTGSAGSHTHTAGSMKITGSVTSTDHTGTYQEALTTSDEFTSSGAMYVSNPVTVTGYSATQDNNAGYRTIGINAYANHGWTGSTSSAGSHTHSLTTASSGSHTHTIGKTGGGTPINIMPPYTTVYMWKRTA